MNNSPVFIIAEIGQAHDGSLGMAHSFIKALKGTGVDAVKFQTHIAEAESSAYEPFRVKFSYEDDTRYDYWRRMEFTPEQWAGLKAACDEAGLEFMSSPFSIAAVDLLEQIGVKRYKVGSGEVSNFLILERIAQTGKPVILSSGMSSYAELDETVAFLKDKVSELSILQCTTAYPTQPEDLGLNVIPELQKRYGLPIGLSDHSGEIFPAIGAAALGAKIIEVHVTFDKRMFGPDATSSLTIDQITEMVRGVRFMEKSLQRPIDKSDNSRFGTLKKMFEKTLAVNKNMQAGQAITIHDLESKKPAGMGIPASEFNNILGQKLKQSKSRYDFLTIEDISNE